MPLSTATVTFDISDLVGVDYDRRRGIRGWIDTNIPNDTVIDTDGNKIRLGSGKVTFNDDGTGSFTVWVPGTGSNPASWQTYFHVEYVDTGNHAKGRTTRTFGPFTITGNADLADLVAEQEVPSEYAGALIAEMEALRNESQGFVAQQESLAAIDDTDTAVAYAMENGTETPAYLSSTFEAEIDPVAQSLAAALPSTLNRVTRSKDTAPSTVKLYVTGSSISVLGGASVEAKTPGPLVAAALQAGLAPLGHVNVTYSIDGQNGSVVNDWSARYTAWRATNPAPQVAFIVAGMNDFTPYNWHRGQTFDSFPGTYGFVTHLSALIDQMTADGVEVILSTTPHRHTQRLPFDGGMDPTQIAGTVYPDSVYTPNGTAGQEHVRPYTLPSGDVIDVEYRYLRGNEAIRSIATEKGCVLLDAERYYFEAVAKYGQDALYDTGMYNHPNDFGLAQSYGKAAQALRAGLRKPTMQATAKKAAGTAIGTSVYVRRVSSTLRSTTTLSVDAAIQTTLTPGTYEVEAALSFYQNGTDATDLKLQPSAPGDATGAWGLIGPAASTTDVKDGNVSTQAQLNLTSPSTVGMVQNGVTLVMFRAVVTIVTGGVFGVQWAPSASPGAVYMNHPLSNMRVTRIA